MDRRCEMQYSHPERMDSARIQSVGVLDTTTRIEA